MDISRTMLGCEMRGQHKNDMAAQQRLLRGGGKKSLLVAYICLIIGGFFGLHHLYLGNVRIARMYLLSLGLCGLGVIHDAVNMQLLVLAANRMSPPETPRTAGTSEAGGAHGSGERSASAMEEGNVEQAPDGGGVRGSAHHNQAPATSALAQALRTPTRRDRQRERRDGRESGSSGWGWGAQAQRVDARQVTMFLCESFPDVAEAQVAKVWEEQRGNVTRCVEVLSELSESMRRQITIIKAPVPKDIGNESMLDESGEKECLVCFGSEMPIDVVLLPCQHSGMCVDCALLVLRTTPPECPVCRTAVEEILRFVGEDPTTPGGYDDTDQAAAHGPDGGAGVLPPSSHGQDDVRDASAEAASATVRSEPQEPDSVVVTCKDVVLREDDHDGADEEIAISHEAGEAGASTKEGERPQEAAAKGVQHST